MRYAHPTPEYKRKAVEVLAAVIGGESKTIIDIQIQEKTSMVTSLSENRGTSVDTSI